MSSSEDSADFDELIRANLSPASLIDGAVGGNASLEASFLLPASGSESDAGNVAPMRLQPPNSAPH
eukprot:4503500-Pleurochrysis_carterae.AAC.1